MPNTLFQALGGGTPAMNSPIGQFANMIQQFNKFRQSFQGDPQQEVMRLLQSGQMSQQQLNQLQQAAQQFQSLLSVK